MAGSYASTLITNLRIGTSAAGRQRVGQMANRQSEVGRTVPKQGGAVVAVDEEDRALLVAGLNERALCARFRQALAVGAANAERLPAGQRLPHVERDERFVEFL